jgi:hypothetical protein
MKRLLLISALMGLLGYLPGLSGQAQANCGPGPVVMQKNKGMLLQSLGATTNATLLPTQTFAITSGTSGCSNSGIIKKDVEQRFFVAVHMQNIYQEMAQGGGVHLETLAVLMGCPAERHGDFARMTRRELERLYPARSHLLPAEMLERLRQEMRAEAVLAQSCSRIS